ncbi:MAG TPA: hypothetical protein VGU01_00115 [Sphingomicrobium sp.]|nr:hypothetical protein [Sphingomicrobium sp.]
MTARFAHVLVFLLSACDQHGGASNAASPALKQAEVVARGRSVMPFDIDRTMHHFQKRSSGSIEQVVSTDGDSRQIALIRHHLEAEADRFKHGNYSDPSTIHGPGMPGLSRLAGGAGHISIRYKELRAGGEITYEASDPTLVRAIHTWFDAQVQEHGDHAMTM